MSAPDQGRVDEVRVFAEPWEAQAFALVVSLRDSGLFTWSEWTQTLGAILKSHGDKADGARYYHHWLEALEAILSTKAGILPPDVEAMCQAWREAAARTPHGMPIELKPEH